jgi:hypothetical protein
LRGFFCILASCSKIAYDCGNSAVLPACRELSEHRFTNVRAEDALESPLALYVAAKEPLPTSSETEADEVMVPLSALGMAKAALYEAIREQGVGRAELARRLYAGTSRKSIACSTCVTVPEWGHVEAALATLGLRLIVDVARAA